MVAPTMCEYVLVALNVHVKGTVWSIEKLRGVLMPSMVVTVVPRELLDVEMKDGLIAGSKGVLCTKYRGELEHLKTRRLFTRPHECPPPPFLWVRNMGTCEQLDKQA